MLSKAFYALRAVTLRGTDRDAGTGDRNFE
jgi:hypothetical protein